MSADVQLKTIKRLDSESGSPEKPPAYADIADGGQTNRSYVPDSSQEDIHVQPMPSVAIETITIEPDGEANVPNGDGVRHRGHGDEAMKIAFDVDQYEESSDEEEEYGNKVLKVVGTAQSTIWVYYEQYKSPFWMIVALILGLMYIAYFLYAMIKYFDADDEGDVRLLWFTLLVAGFISCYIILGKVGDKLWEGFKTNVLKKIPRRELVSTIIYWVLVIGTALFVVIYVITDVAINNRPDNLRSAFGMVVFVLLFWVFSYKPARVQFRPVFWGLAIQFYFALLILRTKWGYATFQWLGDRIKEFLEHTDAGSKFVFGDAYTMHYFAFKVLTVIIFFSSIISMLYYLGAMQFLIRNIARFLAFCLGTSPTESLNAAGNIFIGQSESPLLIRPFIKEMTRSELHAVCTGGFATIAGSVMAAYIEMGVPPNHLLSASVMSAPAALAMAKLFWPETKKSTARAKDVYNMQKGKEHNIIEAASNGASISIKLIANIAVNLIAFIAILDFINATLIWFGHRVDMYQPELTFSLVCSYLFYPLPWIMGCSRIDVFRVASLIGTKTFLNEFVAYAELSVFISNKNIFDEYMALSNGTGTIQEIADSDDILLGNGTLLARGMLTERSTVIATYALCGFSNLASMGIMIGALGAMAPSRKADITKVVVRAMIAGNVACFMTACIAGLLYEGI